MTIMDPFFMCQPKPIGPGAPSCASCCGIYNYMGHSRKLVSEILEYQTRLMSSWDGTEEDIERIRAAVEANRPAVRFPVIYNCPFAGFLDDARTRVGCLLHPLHRGRDLRDYCRYGHRTCGEARCSSYTYLSDKEARAVMAAAPDWYLYGLCITDPDLIKDFFELCEMRVYHPVDPESVVENPSLRQVFADYLSLKETWPYARDPGRFGKYYFIEKSYCIYMIDYLALGLRAERHNNILLCLGSVLDTRQELEDALKIIDELVDRFTELYEEYISQARRKAVQS